MPAIADEYNPFSDGSTIHLRSEVIAVRGNDAVVAAYGIYQDSGADRYGSTQFKGMIQVIILGLTGVAIGDTVNYTLAPTGEIRDGLRCFSIIDTLGTVRGFEPSKRPAGVRPVSKSVPVNTPVQVPARRDR